MENKIKLPAPRNFIEVQTGDTTRFDGLNVAKPKVYADGSTRYSAVLLIPKSDTETVFKIEAAMKEIYDTNPALFEEAFGVPMLFDEVPHLLRDGDLHPSGDESYAGNWYLHAAYKHRPMLVDAAAMPISGEEFRNGDYGSAIIAIYANNFGGTPSFWAQLKGLQLLEHGQEMTTYTPALTFSAKV